MSRNPRSKRTRRVESPPQEELHEASGSGPVQELTDEQLRVIIQSSPVALERGFDLGNVLFEKFYVLFEKLGWNEFAKHPSPPCLALVHEFYSNLHKSTRENEVKVFGKSVKFDAGRINRVLGIPPLEEEDALTSESRVRPDDQEMYHALTLGKGGHLVPRSRALKIGSLCEEARWWRKFMTGRILGNIKEGETTLDQQVMLFCILVGRRFDVGRIINEKINAIKQKIRSGSMAKLALSYPSLITLLCHKVKRPKGSFDSEIGQAIVKRNIASASLEEPSVFEFHAAHWGRRGSPSWTQPQVGAQQHVPTPPPEDEDMQAPEHGSPLHAQFDQNAWQDFQTVQDQRYNDLVGRFDTMNVRLDGVHQQLNTMQSWQEQQFNMMQAQQQEFYGRMNAHFFPDQQPPPNP